jgi:quinol monooxygenase YgiN
MTARPALVVVASATAIDGQAAALETALRDAAGPTRAQPGCINFHLYRRADDPATIVAIEEWASEDEHEHHLLGEHVRALVAKFDTLLSGPPDIVAMTPLAD